KQHAPDEWTIFLPGSLSKVMTATGLLTLLDDPNQNPHLTLDTHADTKLTELGSVCLPRATPDKSSVNCAPGEHLGIRLRHLLSHTSGLADVLGPGNWLDQLSKTGLLFPPGTYSSYSGVGIEALGVYEGRVSNLSYEDFMKQRLFMPLGM